MRYILSSCFVVVFSLFAIISFNVYNQMLALNAYLVSPVDSAQDITALNKLKTTWHTNNKIFGNILFWDATVNYQLGLKSADQARYEPNLGLKDNLYTESFNYYTNALSYRPVFSFPLLEQASLLNEQGAPLSLILPKLDQVLKLSLKESDVRAIFALVCFQILSTELSLRERQTILAKLKSIFIYSIDYRGQANINAYARLFSKQDILKQIQSEVKDK